MLTVCGTLANWFWHDLFFSINRYSASSVDHSYIITFFTTCFILPLGVIFFCYGKLLRKLRKVSIDETIKKSITITFSCTFKYSFTWFISIQLNLVNCTTVFFLGCSMLPILFVSSFDLLQFMAVKLKSHKVCSCSVFYEQNCTYVHCTVRLTSNLKSCEFRY